MCRGEREDTAAELARTERLAQGWRAVTPTKHVNTAGYDAILEKNGVYRLVEAKARASLSLADLHNLVKRANTGEIRFNIDYFQKWVHQAGIDPLPLLSSGNIEIEVYLNGPESARLAQELLAQMGGNTARYLFEDVEHEIRIILTAVSR